MPRPPTIPERYGQAVLWCKARAARWAANAALLTLTQAETDQMQALTAAADQAGRELVAARLAYRSAALTYRTRVGDMRAHAGGLLSRIRAAARTSAQPGAIYSAASIDPPDAPSPTRAPATPARFDVTLVAATGELRIAFTCKHPRGVRGVTYRVERLTSASGALDGRFEFLTTAKTRRFADATIPQGTAVVLYKVTPQTSTKDGDPAIHMVQLASEDVVVASALPARASAA
jgi:hypothetical protein